MSEDRAVTNSKTGQIVWHDLFTPDRERSMAFYRHVANWIYKVERATDFAWGGGEKDFVLALSGGEAGAGFADTPPNQTNGWIAYIEVSDVDAAVEDVDAAGGEIVRHPFEVPGVGRNALVRDPLGALLGVSLSRHTFPVPHLQFGPEVYLSNGVDFPAAFYERIFKWRISAARESEEKTAAIAASSGHLVAFQQSAHWPAATQAVWLPSIKVTSLDVARRVAEANGAQCTERNHKDQSQEDRIILRDADGTFFVLSEA